LKGAIREGVAHQAGGWPRWGDSAGEEAGKGAQGMIDQRAKEPVASIRCTVPFVAS
jgi:hypothetical protein